MKQQKRQLASENEIAAAEPGFSDIKSILNTTVQELGRIFPDCRCLLYRLEPGERRIVIEHEFSPEFMPSLLARSWSVIDNPLFLIAQARLLLIVNDVVNNGYLSNYPTLRTTIDRAAIHSWLILPIRYQEQLLGSIELHSKNKQYHWRSQDVSLIEAIAKNIGAVLSQASVYHDLVQLNERLAQVERVQSNLIAIVGHELRTPLSTIKICLESLATEPDMPAAIKNVMLDTALQDTNRLEELIQSFLTVSKLEGGKAYRNIESTDLAYALNLALYRIQTTKRIKTLPEIKVNFPQQLPIVLADVDGLVEVLIRLLDNACKFTPADGEIAISLQNPREQMLEVIVSDTGRGIESSQLEVIFDRFSQSEDYLRRTCNGVGLGLVIASKIVEGMGGKMWAQSQGKDRGSQFHFTVPTEI